MKYYIQVGNFLRILTYPSFSLLLQLLTSCSPFLQTTQHTIRTAAPIRELFFIFKAPYNQEALTKASSFRLYRLGDWSKAGCDRNNTIYSPNKHTASWNHDSLPCIRTNNIIVCHILYSVCFRVNTTVLESHNTHVVGCLVCFHSTAK